MVLGMGWRGVLLVGMVGVVAGSAKSAGAQTVPEGAARAVGMPDGRFDAVADEGLKAMEARAAELKVTGVAVLSYFKGEKPEGWRSEMAVVGRLRDDPAGGGKSSNLLAIAYAKSAEMADTLKNSGSGVRPPLTGEVGWEGGVVVQLKDGYLLAAFSGGQSADDVAVSRAGIARVVGSLGAKR